MNIDNDLFKKEFERFLSHLKEHENNRILFSAPFGIGKTTFVKQFFENAEVKPAFNVFHLYPVNYSIATNEDIIKYLKFDLIYSIVDKKILLEVRDFNHIGGLKQILKEDVHKVLAPLLLFVPKVGKDLFDIYKELDKVKELYLEACANNTTDEATKFLEYIIEIQNQSGGLYEIDVYTKLIKNILLRIKDDGEIKKQNILIIDDLDRIDPAHIFRLLNVFAAHFDTTQYGKTEDNKFGFDKVIFVCDIENIRNIFSHFYGKNVDFNGYIDKFYSKTIFYFSNEYVLNNWIENNVFKGAKTDLQKFQCSFLILVLTHMINEGKINFRSILKLNTEFVHSKYQLKRHELRRDAPTGLLETATPFIVIYLSYLAGSTSSLIHRLIEMDEIFEKKHNKEIKLNRNYADSLAKFYHHIIFPVIFHTDHSFKEDEEFSVIPNLSSPSFKVEFLLERVPLENIYRTRFKNTPSSYPKMNEDFWKHLRNVVEIFQEIELVE